MLYQIPELPELYLNRPIEHAQDLERNATIHMHGNEDGSEQGGCPEGLRALPCTRPDRAQKQNLKNIAQRAEACTHPFQGSPGLPYPRLPLHPKSLLQKKRNPDRSVDTEAWQARVISCALTGYPWSPP